MAFAYCKTKNQTMDILNVRASINQLSKYSMHLYCASSFILRGKEKYIKVIYLEEAVSPVRRDDSNVKS
jgi:hypothetical protein